MHEGVRRWTKNVDIFTKDYLVVPIHDELHWSLALVCFPGSIGDPDHQPAILHLDSLKGMHKCGPTHKSEDVRPPRCQIGCSFQTLEL